LFLEAPRDVGYSRGSPHQKGGYNDTATAVDNADALKVFFDRFPEFKHREFFITGESYAGVYVPTLAAELIRRFKNKQMLDVNLVGLAIGNGLISYRSQINSIIDMFYYRGFY
uniref:Carboxypeptidase n=1 Tax=Anisakis simplex TaxID=6269 RepID=A0A0M3JFQ3_ANISI